MLTALLANAPFAQAPGMGLNAFFHKDSRRTRNHQFPVFQHNIRATKWLDEEEVKIVFAFILSLPGAPFIYYGDELGMRYLADVVSVEGGYIRGA